MAVSNENISQKEVLLKAIGERLKQLRKLEGYSNHEDFAFDKGINRSQYGKYENGKSDLQISTLVKIINCFSNMTLESFFKGIDIPDDL
ncbi:helix-turn-helix domain-containing protein [Algoriphagus sp. PAP.12]|jgi:transcriptional regulator with XRE-family HTH domain|uniref:helix-turn-helix domain-containing protein n=1 Tax=Algoriphagus sp. PAP.12 TaxID=2996678 RepID=UPI00227D3D52|nr:helix-turn-helix transcriptional regulator [Algoriphagus sp. PAP.12]